MPFGLVTKAQLDALRDELKREIAESSGLPEDIAMQWESWYAKFRALYARLMKQATKRERELAEGDGEQLDQVPPRPWFRSRRGF